MRISTVFSLIWGIDFSTIRIKLYYYTIVFNFNDNLKKTKLYFFKKLLAKDQFKAKKQTNKCMSISIITNNST